MTTTKDTSPNENCLEGWQCPDCKSWGPFRVQSSRYVILFDEGTEDDDENGDTEFKSGNFAQCMECDKEATVGYFRQCSGPCVAGLMPGETCEDGGRIADEREKS